MTISSSRTVCELSLNDSGYLCGMDQNGKPLKKDLVEGHLVDIRRVSAGVGARGAAHIIITVDALESNITYQMTFNILSGPCGAIVASLTGVDDFSGVFTFEMSGCSNTATCRVFLDGSFLYWGCQLPPMKGSSMQWMRRVSFMERQVAAIHQRVSTKPAGFITLKQSDESPKISASSYLPSADDYYCNLTE